LHLKIGKTQWIKIIHDQLDIGIQRSSLDYS